MREFSRKKKDAIASARGTPKKLPKPQVDPEVAQKQAEEAQKQQEEYKGRLRKRTPKKLYIHKDPTPVKKPPGRPRSRP